MSIENPIPALAPQVYQLANGLTVILLEDHRCPLVGVNLNYRVGSMDERPGRTGLAHLFEHLMFQGSKHFNDVTWKALEDVGGAVNGATNPDRTRYWELLPAAYLERALWLEADRMGHFLPALTQERLDTQRSVVLNERRQNYENRPYGLVWERLLSLLYPPDHPYHWPTIGVAADIAAATLEDVRQFFIAHYHPGNASLCLVGDFRKEEAMEAVEKYFGDIPPGPLLTRMGQRAAPLPPGEVSLTMEDRVQLPRTYLAWPTPPLYAPEDAALDACAHILGRGRTSRLYRRLVYELGIAQEAIAAHSSQQLAGVLTVALTPRPGHTLKEVEAEAFRVLDEFLTQGPTSEELQRVVAVTVARLTRAMESVGGFAGLSDLMNQYYHYLGEPDRLRWDLERTLQLAPESVRETARRYLGPHRVAVRVLPRPPVAAPPSTGAPAVDRRLVPGPGRARTFTLPPVRQLVMLPGVRAILVERRGLPVLAATLVAPGGASADPVELPGLAALTAAVLPEGAGGRTAQQLAETLERLGAHLEVSAAPDALLLSLSALSSRAAEALALLADVALRPTLAEEELQRQRIRRLVQLRQLLDSPDYLARTAARQALFGAHPYARSPLGTPAGVDRITLEDVRRAWVRSFATNQLTMVVVGDVSSAALEGLLADAFASRLLKDRSPTLPTAPPPPRRTITLVNRPGAPQSVIAVILPAPPRNTPHYAVLEVLNAAFGGQFVSRLNLNLREAKGFTYGARSRFEYLRVAGEFLITAPVETRATAAALGEIMAELEGMAGPRPLTPEEVARAASSLALGFPRRLETSPQLARALAETALYELGVDALERFPREVAAVTADAVAAVAGQVVRPEQATIVVVGDRAAVAEELTALDLGLVQILDPEALATTF